MKLNKKLLTAALAGALIVTAVPASTFAYNKAENSYTQYLGLSKKEAAEQIAKLTAKINDLSAKRAKLVTQEFNPAGTPDGLIEKLQKEEAAAKKAYEAAKANFEAAEKGLEAAKGAQEKARLAEIKAVDAYNAKVGEYDALVAKAKGERDAAVEKANREFKTAQQNFLRESQRAKVAYDKAVADREAAEEALETAKKQQSGDTRISMLEEELAAKKQVETTAKNKYDAEVAKIDDTLKAAQNSKDSAIATAENILKGKLNQLNKKYKLSEGYNGSAADLTLIQREKDAAVAAHKAAIENTRAAQKAYNDALASYKSAKKKYSVAIEKTYKTTEDFKNIEKDLKENYTIIEIILKDQNKSINDLSGQLAADAIKELEDYSKLSGSEKAADQAKILKEIDKAKSEYNKAKSEIKEVKSVYTYKFAVKDTTGKGVQGLALKLKNVEDTSKVYNATSDENGDILIHGVYEGTYEVEVVFVPNGYHVVQDGKQVSEVKALFRAESEVKAENNVEKTEAKKEEAKDVDVKLPKYIQIKGSEEKEEATDKKDNKDEKVVDGGTIVVEKDKKDNKKDNKKPEKKETKKPATPAKPNKKKLPKAGAAAEAATIAAAAMATMGGAYLSLKKRK